MFINERHIASIWFLIILYLIDNYSCYGQQNQSATNKLLPATIDKISIDTRTNDLKYRKAIDSLQRELLYYRVKDDYYSDALSEQANRFSLIVGGLLALAGLVSWAFLQNKITSLEKEVDETLKVQLSINEAFAQRYRDDYRRNNFSLGIAFSLMYQTDIFEDKHYVALVKAVFNIDLLAQVFGKGNESEYSSDVSRMLESIKAARSCANYIKNNHKTEDINSFMTKRYKTIIENSINASIEMVSDREVLEKLFELKNSVFTMFEKISDKQE